MFTKVPALLLILAGGLPLAAQSRANQSSTISSSLASSSTTITVPPRYFVEAIGISAPGAKPRACQPDHDHTGITVDPPEQVYVGDAPFPISGKAGDGQAVTIGCADHVSCCSGDGCSAGGPWFAELKAVKDTYILIPNKAGTAHLLATEQGHCADQAAPKPFTVKIVDNQLICIDGLESRRTPKKSEPGAATIAQNLGNPYPFTFQVSGSQILVYSARMPLRAEDREQLEDFKRQVAQLIDAGAATASDPSKPEYSVELSIPHAAQLGDLATKLGTLNYTDFKVQDIGSDKVRITSSSVPACSQLTTYLRDIRHLVWKPRPENPVTKVFNSDATAVSTALAPPASGSGGGSGSGTGSGGGNANPAGGGTMPVAAAGGSASQGSAPATASGTITANATVTTTPASGASSSPSGMAMPASPTATPAAASIPATTVAAVGSDQLVFSDGVIGDDASIQEKKRLVALLDLPRPQVIMNVWTAQSSSKDEQLVGKQTNNVTQFVKQYNDILQTAINAGWQHLRNEIAEPSKFFDHTFYAYLVGRYAAIAERPGSTPLERAQEVVGYSSITDIPPGVRTQLGFCPADKYCLGYTSLFQPITPRLTDLLIAVIAAQHPAGAANQAVDHMETAQGGRAISDKELLKDQSDPPCVKDDKIGAASGHFYLECFRRAANVQLANDPTLPQPNQLGLLRASLTDFLFQYKVSQVYPHDFSAYQLTQSAHTLDSALAPMIEAFNQDLAAYQTEMARLLRVEAESQGWVGSEKDTFINQGLITVRTISGIDTVVNTTSQSFLDVTQQPTLAALASSIAGAKQTDTTTGGHLTDVFQNLTPIQAQVILGTVSAFQSSKVQIGRSLNIDVTPRSLSGADTAELSIKLNVDESASPTYFTSSSSAADISRVATHDTNTHIRVDSIKLFNVSTMTGQLQKARTRFPLLPPLVEIPYLGTLVGVPLPPAKEFHSSNAVISAIIVPTASDIALGLQFTDDFIVDSDGATNCYYKTAGIVVDAGGVVPNAETMTRLPRCRFRRASNLGDIDQFSAVSLFHKEMITCIANGNQQGTPTIALNQDNTVHLATTTDCSNLSLRNLELSAQ